MHKDNTPSDMEDNLEEFEQDFFETREPKEEEVKEEVQEDASDEAGDDHPAPDEDDEEEPDEDDDEDSEEEEEPEPVKAAKPKNKTQLRIEQLVAEARQAERDRDALAKRVAELEAGNKEVKEPAKLDLPAEAPNPEAVDEDGNPIYELGEFDPKFIRDLTKFTIEQETKEAKAQAEREAATRAEQAIKDQIVNEYSERFAKAEEELPDLREKVASLQDAFQNVEPSYGEYLAMTIMSMETGPQIMHYLSQNIGEAQRIVASGPAAATLALGRLDARLAKVEEKETKRNNKEVSKAGPPPEERARGRGGRFTVAPDTDDLDAFERVFYNKG